MDKRSCLLNNPTGGSIRVTELNLSLPPGVSNLFELNPDLNYELIDYCLRNGTLRAAMDNGLCYLVPDMAPKSLSPDILIRQPLPVQVLPPRARFAVMHDGEAIVFDPQEQAELFENEDVKPARLLEEELRKAADNVQTIEATVKEAQIPEKPIENRYTPVEIKQPEVQRKIKNDLTMGYETCHGKTAEGKICMRRAKTGQRFCFYHKDQE